MKKRVKALALCIIRDRDRILVGEGKDPTTQKVFYRPLGGSIEFGERAKDTIIRELREELGIELTPPRMLGSLENIFEYDGEPGHEVILVFEAEPRDAALSQKESLERIDKKGRAVWKSLSSLQKEKVPLYPNGLLEMLSPQ